MFSRSITQRYRYGTEDLDLYQNVTDPEHCLYGTGTGLGRSACAVPVATCLLYLLIGT
jgi:hypothetical protein